MIRLFKVAMSPEAKRAAGDVLDSGYIGQGPKVEEFEEELEVRLDLPRRPLTTNSCTSALDLALELIDVRRGDFVITTPMTCTATNGVIVKRGAIPLWADVDPKTGLIDPISVAKLFGEYGGMIRPHAPWEPGYSMTAYSGHRQLRGVMAVDWAGTLADYDGLRRAAPGLPIIQDAAHSFGAGIGGDYVAWSFQAIKHLTTGDGGALLTPAADYHRAKLLRWYGLDRESSDSFRCEQDIQQVGFKYHMNDIAASIGLANLPLAVKNLQKHRDNAYYLAKALGIEFDPTGSYWFFPIFVNDRDGFIKYAADHGIEASPVHARNDKHSGFQHAYSNVRLPGTDYFSEHFVAVPCGWWLTSRQLEWIVIAVKAWNRDNDWPTYEC